MATGTWTDRVRGTLEFLPREFTVDDAYRFIPQLQRAAPANRHVPAKIRQQLQILVDAGSIERLERGVYRQREDAVSAPEWTFHAGDLVSRSDVAAALGRPDYAIPRGMFSPSSGPSSKRMVLFSNLQKNPYGDRREARAFIYTGEKGRQEGVLDGFNKMLATHAENGMEVHLFTTSQTEAGKHRYEGEVVVGSWTEVFRPKDGRLFFEFRLVPTRRLRIGSEIQKVVEADLGFHLAERARIPTQAEITVRDRAFRATLLPAYDFKCAVCGPTLNNERYADIQAAHVLAVHDAGPDAPNNGVALCARHHWAFDHGIFAVSRDLEVILPEDFRDPHRELRHGAPVRRPTVDEWRPLPEYLELHQRKWGLSAA